MSIHKTEGIVLKKQDFRETSLIANFYTRDFGKISGILKGIRTDIAKFASTVEPFSHNDIIFYKKINSSLHLISQCEEKNNFSGIRQSVFKISSGSFMMELLDKIMPQEEKNEDIFDLALAALKGLETSDNPHKIITIFKIKILALSGFKPHLDSCVCCGMRINGQSKFSLSLGGLLCQRCIHKDISARSIYRGTVATILHIERNTLQDNLTLGMNPEIKKELDLILNSFLNFHLERELKSQKVLDKLKID
jgi:DNA repair protein RecO (recombination protein O)